MEELLLGIDFGTTNTIISIFKNNKVTIFNDGIYKSIPSKIGYNNNNIYFGNYIPNNCSIILKNFKLLYNQKFTLDKEYTYEEIIFIFFKHVFILIKKKYDINLISVISCPSNFNNIQRELLKNTLNTIGFNVIRIINEPTAAALAHGLNYKDEIKKIMVIDIGGGTTDFTVLEKNETFFEVIDTNGINIGGNNFTEIIINDILKINNEIINNNYLFILAENIKEKLSWIDNYHVDNINYSLSREKFNNLCNNLLNQLKENIMDILNNNNIQDIILVGGTCKIPSIQNMIKNIDITKKILIYNNLESIVSEGNSIYCAILNDKYKINNDIILLDILSLSIGVELSDGTYSIIIPKNTTLPIKINQKYTTNNNLEKSIKINFYQGEHNIAKHNYLLGEYIFNNLSILGIPILDICIEIDINSIIIITITDKKSGEYNNIIFNNNKFITDFIKLNYNFEEKENIKLQYFYLIKNHININLQNLNNNHLLNKQHKINIIEKFNIIENNINIMNNLELINVYKDLLDNFTIINTVESTNDNNYLNIHTDNLNTNELINENIDKNELFNLCNYLKIEIDDGNLDIKNINLLNELINNNLILINNNDDINWKEQINIFNDECKKIYYNN